MPEPVAATRGMWALAAIFATSGVLHFVRPRPYEALVPRWLPARRGLVHVTGAAELGCALALAVPVTRRAGGLASTGLLVLVFPANVQMAYDVHRRRSGPATIAAVGRLPLQLPMIRTAWRTWRPQARRALTTVSSATPAGVGRSAVRATSTTRPPAEARMRRSESGS